MLEQWLEKTQEQERIKGGGGEALYHGPLLWGASNAKIPKNSAQN